MEAKHLTRQWDLVPQEILNCPITVIGAGAVGSCAILALAKMGFDNIQVFDDDAVSVENISNQFYRISDIGKPKVDALYDIVLDYSGTKIKNHNERWTPDKTSGRVLICAVDNMATRSDAFDFANSDLGYMVKHLIDPRMGGQEASLFTWQPGTESEWYKRTLKRDDQIPNEPCTAKATMFTAMMLGGLVAQSVRDCLMNKQKNWIAWPIKDYALEVLR